MEDANRIRFTDTVIHRVVNINSQLTSKAS